jgi:drug/metabolite transporter (DMT)-like permease
MTSGDAQLAVLMGLTSAAGFAVSNALQHQAAGSVPREVNTAVRVLARVARKPAWLMAMAVSLAAVTLHGSALKYGSVSMVQPLMVVGVVMAVLVRAALDLAVPTLLEMRAVLITMGGLAVLLACSAPGPSGGPPAYQVIGLVAVVGFTLAVLVLNVLSRVTDGPLVHAIALSVTSGLMFGLTAGLLKLLGLVLSSGDPARVVPVLAGLVVAGALGIGMNQRAYQMAPLSLAMPLINLVAILVAVTIGVLVFHELPAHTPVLLGLQSGAVVCLGLGLREIARLADRPARSALITERTAS